MDLLAGRCLDHFVRSCCNEEEEQEELGDNRSFERGRAMLRELLGTKTSFSSTPLLIAAARNNTQSITTLLCQGIDPNIPNNQGHTTAVTIAAATGAVRSLQALGWDRRIDFNAFNNKQVNPLLAACRNGHVRAVQFLWEHGRGVDQVVDFSAVDREGYGCAALAALQNHISQLYAVRLVECAKEGQCRADFSLHSVAAGD